MATLIHRIVAKGQKKKTFIRLFPAISLNVHDMLYFYVSLEILVHNKKEILIFLSKLRVKIQRDLLQIE